MALRRKYEQTYLTEGVCDRVSKAEDSLPVSQINKEDMEMHAMMYVNRAGEGEEGRHISLDWRGEGGEGLQPIPVMSR